MTGVNRISGAGRLTPARTARFTFDGRTLTALEGDTVASALIANDIHLVGRSFKYHRPRGILSAGAEETECVARRLARCGPPAAERAGHRPGGLRRHEGVVAEPLALARLRCRWVQRSPVTFLRGRFLLQDLHVAEGRVAQALRTSSAAPPALALRRRSPIRIIMRAVTSIATCW